MMWFEGIGSYQFYKSDVNENTKHYDRVLLKKNIVYIISTMK